MKSHNHESSLDIIELIHIETDLGKADTQATTSATKTHTVLAPLVYNQYEERNVSNASTLSSIIAFMSQFTGIILIKCLYAVQHDRLKDYADIGLAAFGKPGQIIGYFFSQSMLFLTPTIYIILASQNISDILTHYGFIWLDTKTCIWIIAVIVGIPFILVRNMKDVYFLSTFASMATVCLLLMVCVASMANFSEQTELVHHDFAIPRKIPIAFSTFSFSYCGHVIYPHLEASMVTPKRWSKVLLVATCVISIMYLTMGVVCYFVFGDTAQSPIYKSLSTDTMVVAQKVNIQDTRYLQKIAQVIKPLLAKEEVTDTRLLLLNKNMTDKIQPESAAVVFDSLLHRSAAISKNPNSLGYEETFTIYK
ncbi:hypothetical protein HPULCUR_008665 [Helicostylum pulchrum]|uniref:Amino acid transporter transmembrane domain-containing protein n=1 Tax=Helicostylum pulchrum TaxID=562976 RepID=A0ABP9Y886_9FUNG